MNTGFDARRSTGLESVGSCDLCGGAERSKWETYERFGLEFSFVRCASCGLAYLSPRPTPESIGAYYDAEYTAIHGEYAQPRWMTHVTPLLRQLLSARYGSSRARRGLARAVLPWERKWQQILAANHLQSIDRIGRILDVGCGHGYWLGTMRRWGFDCVGCEPDPAGAQAAAASGIEVVESDLLGAGFPAEEFDVVRFSHVLEHVHSPTIVLSEALRVTRRRGLVIIIVPNHGGLVAQSFRHVEDVPRHLFAFTPATLRRYFEKVGLEMLMLRTVTDFAHSIYGMFLPPTIAALRATNENAASAGTAESFFSFKNQARDREYAATTAFADSLGLGASVVAVGRRCV